MTSAMPSAGIKFLAGAVWALAVAPLPGWVFTWRLGFGHNWIEVLGFSFALPAVLAAVIGTLLGWRVRAVLMVLATLIVSSLGLLVALMLIAQAGS